MCGIAGFISKNCDEDILARMGDVLTHRGPDDTGYYYSKCRNICLSNCHSNCQNNFQGSVGLVLKRLSIIDVENGKQPAYNESGNVVVILNGEIFNFRQLRTELELRGHRISNNSDTAVLPHMYEEYGLSMFSRLSGQFAIAVYDEDCGRLVLARDRMGIIPLSYYHKNGEFLFASEIKSILATGRVTAELDYTTLFDTFTFWSPQYDRTSFKGISNLMPGEYLIYRDNEIKRDLFYSLKYNNTGLHQDFGDVAEETEMLLSRAVQKRLIGDVKISTYLSGGLDSSLITAIIASRFNNSVEAFSVGFEDAVYDEHKYQKMVCDHLGIRQHKILFSNSETAGLIKKIVWHTEVPLLRAGPVPLYKLSGLVNGNNIKVVLSGEGADELFGGYDIFREVKIRSYLKKYPDSELRKQLFRKVNLFSDSRLQSATAGSLNYFYMHGNEDRLMESHYTRWRQFGFFERFFSDKSKQMLKEQQYPDFYRSLGLEHLQDIDNVNLHDMVGWSDIQRSQYFEIKTFLSQYLLCSQGDRVSMAHSVEVRFPFLDEDLLEYSMSLNDRFKIKGLNEKYILKKIAEKYLPGELVNRKKFPYRSPMDVRKILCDSYMEYIVSEESLRRFNVFNPAKIGGFIKSVTEREFLSERESMLFMGVLTTQILCDTFQLKT